MRLTFLNIKKFIKNNFIRILIVLLFVILLLFLFFSMFATNKDLLRLIDANRKQLDDLKDKIDKNNMEYTISKIQLDIKNKLSDKEKENIENEIKEITEDNSLSLYEKNKELNKIHESIKIFK